MKKPYPLPAMLGAIVLWSAAFIGFVLLSAVIPEFAPFVKQAKALHALGIWVWVYQLTASVARWKGRRGWAWFLLGLLAMWGSVIGLGVLGFAINLPLVQAGERAQAVRNVSLFALGGFFVGYLATAVVSGRLRRSAALPGSPEREDERLEPDCDVVFRRYCAPHYAEAELARRPYSDTRPDMEGAGPPTLGAEAAEEVAGSLIATRARVLEEWPGRYGVQVPLGLSWVEAFDAYYDRGRAADVLDRSQAEATSEACLGLCCEFALVLADTLRQRDPSLAWLYEEPFWESALVHPAGYRINVFHWAVKKFSGYGCDDGFAAKIEACLGSLEAPGDQHA